MSIFLSTKSGFSLPAVVRSHGWVQMAPFAETEDGGFTYVVRLDTGHVVKFSVRAITSGLRVDVTDLLSEAEQAELTNKVTWMLGLEQDFTDFYALAQVEPKLARMVANKAGRVLRSPTLFEDVVRTLLTTNTLWQHTLRMSRELVDRFGDPLPCDLERHAFPTAQQLSAAGETALRQQARMGYRAPYVATLAGQVASGELDLEALKHSHLPTPELRKRLLSIKGVGSYAAANLLMLLGRYDYVPVDSWALKVVSKEFFGGTPITPRQVLETFERWGQWQGLAYWFWEWEF